MAVSDKVKWDEKYRTDTGLLQRSEPAKFVREHFRKAGGKRAIDLACGGGRNTLFLARHGFCVDALDISSVAIETLRKRSEGLCVDAICVDLDRFEPRKGIYDLALMVNFLDRGLIRRMAEALKPGGLFIVETYMKHDGNEKTGNPDFLLEPGELKEILGQGFEILSYEEFWNGEEERYRMRKQGVAARKQDDG